VISVNDLELRPVSIEDSDILLLWRNSEHIRINMLNGHIIGDDEHKKWILSMLNDNSSDWLIVEYNQKPVGVIYITNINKSNSTCTWGMYVDDSVMGTVIGVLMELIAIDRMVYDFNIRKIWGETLELNSRLLAMHKKFGFEVEGVYKDHVFRCGKYIDVYRISLFGKKWKKHRCSILSLLGIKE
jgi:UDP-4-amino-4,6-dideoxy-N-acetyl-beta-L-altrosamine N-acetyltransferase